VSESDRDLVAALRAELAGIDPSRACDRRAEMAGLGAALATREPSVARLALRLEREIGRDEGRPDDRPHVVLPPAGRRAYRVRHDGAGPVGAFAWDDAADHCRLAYLRGLFLARGSLSLSTSRAHLEFVLSADDARILVERLAVLEMPAGWRLRRGRGVVTWKSSETIGVFLRSIGAGPSLLELEARRVARALRGDLNRVINAESANLQRMVAASVRQVEAIDRLEAGGRLASLPPGTLRVAEARRLEPDATLTELAESLGVHRSAVQRALERIEWLALHDDPDDRPRRRAAARERHPDRHGSRNGPLDWSVPPARADAGDGMMSP
jgi:hypothetical protein